jgi:tetratricopeptide (TPR) repeat protein
MIQLVPKGEDWVGFKEAMDKSSIEDRDLIIRILQRTSDLQAREQEIKNISKTYNEISEKIFPGLRRCIIRVNYTVEGFSDQELKSMVSNPSSLKYEECLRGASLVDDLTVKANAYKAAQGMSGADYRATNNLGVVYYNQGNMSGAAQEFEKAYGMKKNSETSNNQGVMTRLNGDKKKAAAMYSESGSTEAQYNTGIMQIMAGNYGSAIASMGNYKSFNTALAKCLNKDYNGAKSDMESSNDNTAMGFYLRAIIAARLNDANGVKDNLAKAIEKDGKLAEKSKSDLEFRNFQGK